MLMLVTALALAAFAGGAFSCLLAPKVTAAIGLFFFIVGTWWQKAATKFAVVRNFVFIFAGSVMLTAGIVVLGFGIFSLSVLTLWAGQYEPSPTALATSGVTFILYIWGTGEAVARGLAKVATKRVPGRSWIDALLSALFV